MFERFTDRARKVMVLAEQEAQRSNHKEIDTGHILLGLVKEGNGVGARVLKNLGVELKKLRNAVWKIVESGPDMVTNGKLLPTLSAKKAVDYAIEEARALHHDYIGTEHLLLGLLRDADNTAVRALKHLGVLCEQIRNKLLNMSGESEENGEFLDTD